MHGFGRDPGVACTSGLTLPSALETPAQQAFELYGGMSRGFEPRVYDQQRRRLYPYTGDVFGASNNVALRRYEFLDRGGFDTRLGPATPALRRGPRFVPVSDPGGRSIAFEPSALVWHEHRREYADLCWQVFTYSAGFTALSTKWISSDRTVVLDLARRVPRLMRGPALCTSRRSGRRRRWYPKQLRWLERAGFLYGPVAYARARRASRPDPSASRAASGSGAAVTASASGAAETEGVRR